MGAEAMDLGLQEKVVFISGSGKGIVINHPSLATLKAPLARQASSRASFARSRACWARRNRYKAGRAIVEGDPSGKWVDGWHPAGLDSP